MRARTENEISNLENSLMKSRTSWMPLDKIDVKDKLLSAQNVKTTEKEAEVKALQEKLTTLKEEVDKIGENTPPNLKTLPTKFWKISHSVLPNVTKKI